MRKVFFSFHYKRDAWRVSQVRNSNRFGAGFENPYFDRAGWEEVKQKGDTDIRRWIDSQIKGTSVTVVLIGAQTASRRWVRYEIDETLRQGHGLIGVYIHLIEDSQKHVDMEGPNPLPRGTPTYGWLRDGGRENLGTWIENAALKRQ